MINSFSIFFLVQSSSLDSLFIAAMIERLRVNKLEKKRKAFQFDRSISEMVHSARTQ